MLKYLLRSSRWVNSAPKLFTTAIKLSTLENQETISAIISIPPILRTQNASQMKSQ